jgi:hypothetical protein
VWLESHELSVVVCCLAGNEAAWMVAGARKAGKKISVLVAIP